MKRNMNLMYIDSKPNMMVQDESTKRNEMYNVFCYHVIWSADKTV